MTKVVVYEDLRLQYLYFCDNPLRDDQQVMREYDLLVNHPRVTGVGFLRPNVMIVSTDSIIISDQGRRLIGEFIIFLFRHKTDGYWEVDFRFQNVTNPLSFEEKDSTDEVVAEEGRMYMHPHIYAADDDVLGCPNGALCIDKGQFGIYQHLRKGEIHLVTPKLIETLETYPTGTPYMAAYSWPLWNGGSDGV